MVVVRLHALLSEVQAAHPDIGGVCSFPGRLFRGGNDVTRGCRYIIPLFIYLDFNRSGKRRGYILDAASIPPPSLDGVDSHPGWGVGSPPAARDPALPARASHVARPRQGLRDSGADRQGLGKHGAMMN